jgi:hypothetical protein
VLTGEGLFPAAVTHLITARNRISQAQANTNSTQRRALVQQAINKLVEARAAVATIVP